MKQPTALIAEDEAPQHAELRAYLGQLWPELQIVADCEDGLAALEALQAHRPDVAFLDIRMPGISGLEVARVANGIAHVVFTTAYDEYAVQAFERGAIDYLLKPIQRQRLDQALQRVKERLAAGNPPDISAAIAALQAQIASRPAPGAIRWVTATIGQTTRIFPIEDVLFFRSQDKYTRVVTANDEAQIRMPLKELLDSLDPQTFWQIHRSVIVRYDAIRLVRRRDDGHWTLQVRGREEELPVSSVFQYRFRGM
ncbi:MAG TPA: LytTR family DNA-binding domain-containing protein [Povalibacter sp.]|nr:LytTR family DNA-binding domain-containing protein [Povalibacter sp.]